MTLIVMETSNLYKVTHMTTRKSAYVVAETQGDAIDKFIAHNDVNLDKYDCMVRWVNDVIV